MSSNPAVLHATTGDSCAAAAGVQQAAGGEELEAPAD